MTMNLQRAYRVLGLPRGAAPDDVHAAYRDLAQVWHPDRFTHNERLRAKADRNFQRINEAYALLKDVQPSADAPPASAVTATLDTVRDLGDILQTAFVGSPAGRARRRMEVLGLGTIEHTGEYRSSRRRPGRRGVPLGTVVVACILVGFAVVVTTLLIW
jgi:hypothetical protein